MSATPPAGTTSDGGSASSRPLRCMLVGRSAVHRRLVDQLTRVASTDAEILITGPTGTGKELYARLAHAASRRASYPFVAVNCGSLAHELLENELFGHVGGAFTGARPKSIGLVQAAEHGTLFLDEINSLTIPCQIKLLRFLQDREYRRLGEVRVQKADIRIIAATNADLVELINRGLFRSDLYFRLRVVPVFVPPLAERPDDIEPLIETLSADAADHYGLDRIVISEAALKKLIRYPWPGNVRELQNCVRCLTCLQLKRPIDPDDLPLLARVPNDPAAAPDEAQAEILEMPSAQRPLREVKRELVMSFERRYVEAALSRSGGNVSRAAESSGKTRRVFFELMRKYEIDPAAFRMAAKRAV
jgi:DNA-binding NtrC family response regulator